MMGKLRKRGVNRGQKLPGNHSPTSVSKSEQAALDGALKLKSCVACSEATLRGAFSRRLMTVLI